MRQHAAEIPQPCRILHQRDPGAHEVDTLDDQTLGKQGREIIPQPYFVEVRHLYALAVAQNHIAHHEGSQQGTA